MNGFVWYRLQLAEAQSKREMMKKSLPKPLIGHETEEGVHSEEDVSELQQMELHNMDLQVCKLSRNREMETIYI